MDPTLSPYGTPGTPPAQNNQLAMMLKQLLGNQQNQPGSGGGAPPQGGQPGQPGQGGGQDQGPFGGAGNVIKGLFNPPPTSILGQARTGLQNMFSPSPASAATPPAGLGTYEGNIPSPANPAGPGTMGIMPSSPMAPPSASPSMGGSATDPSSFAPSTQGMGSNGIGPMIMGDPGAAGGAAPQNPFGFGANPAGPDAMTQALMAPPAMAANPAGFGGGAALSDMLML